MPADDAPPGSPGGNGERRSDEEAQSSTWWWAELLFQGVEVVFWAIALICRLIALAFAAIVSSCS